MRLGTLRLRGNHVAAHARHLLVDDHRVHRAREEQLQPFVAPGRFQNFIAVAFEQHLAADKPLQWSSMQRIVVFSRGITVGTSPVRPGAVSFKWLVGAWKNRSAVKWRAN